MGTFLAFRARRDVWVLVLAAVFIISEFGRFVRSEPSFGLTKLRAICVIVALTVTISLVGCAVKSRSSKVFQRLFIGFRVIHTDDKAVLATVYDPMYYLYLAEQRFDPCFHKPQTYFYFIHMARRWLNRYGE